MSVELGRRLGGSARLQEHIKGLGRNTTPTEDSILLCSSPHQDPIKYHNGILLRPIQGQANEEPSGSALRKHLARPRPQTPEIACSLRLSLSVSPHLVHSRPLPLLRMPSRRQPPGAGSPSPSAVAIRSRTLFFHVSAEANCALSSVFLTSPPSTPLNAIP